jgi:uncharacterized protein
MDLKERLMEDLKQAMRVQDTRRRDTIRMVRSAIKNAEIEMQREADDAKVIELLGREVRMREEALLLFRQGKREDLVAKTDAEIAILQEYMPRQLEEAEIREAVQGVVDELGASDMRDLGAVMQRAMSELKGRADGRMVNQIAREILST